MVIPQAMACKLPVICTVNTGGGDIVRDGVDGFVVKTCSKSSLKEKILYMYENRDKLAEMSNNAFDRVRNGYTWIDYGHRLYKEYKTRGLV